MNQTKGFTTLRGQIFGVEKEPTRTDYKNTLRLRVKTSEDNSVWVTAGGWNTSKLSVNIKADGMEQYDKIPEADIADTLADYFRDGDFVSIKARVDVNTYGEGRLDQYLSGIYHAEEIDFTSDEFEERNEMNIPAVITRELTGDELVVSFANYKGETVTQTLVARNEIINEFLGTVNVGDLVPMSIKIVNKPIYEEVEGSEQTESKQRTTLLGRNIGGNSKKNRKIVGNINELEIIDIDVEKIVKGAYAAEDLGVADQESPF